MNLILPYAKAYAALVGAVCTALLGVYASDSAIGQVLTVVAVTATVVATFRIPNTDPLAEHQDESVQPPDPENPLAPPPDPEPEDYEDPALNDPALKRLQ